LADSDSSKQADPPCAQDKPNWIARCIRAVQRHLQERRAYKELESPIDRAARSTSRASWVIAILTLVNVGVGGATYFVLGGQLDEMKAARESGDKSTTAQIGVMQTQAAAMQGQLQQMKTTADAAHADNAAALSSQSRPWVSFGISGPIKGGTSLKITIQWQNVGHSPALKMRVNSQLHIIKEGDRPPEPLVTFDRSHGDDVISYGVLLPGQVSTQVLVYNSGIILTENDMQFLVGKKFSLWIIGRSEYLDATGSNHFTMFRGDYIPDIDMFVYTEDGNDAN